jgi:cytoskeletal protein RodZ
MKGQGQPWDDEQAKWLAELGRHLGQARQQSGLSLEQISSQTHIPVRQLRAIEQGDMAGLPEGVYIQSFIRQYGNALGLDGSALAQQFPALPNLNFGKTSWRTHLKGQLRPIHLYGFYVLLVLAAVSGLSYFMSRSTTVRVAGQPINTNQALTPTPTKSPTMVSASPSPSPQPPEKAVKVSLTLVGQSWIRVTTDGKTQFEGVLPQGTQRTWMADNQIILRSGNAGGILVSLNESKPKPMGAAGAVEEAIYGASSQPNDQDSSEADLAATTSNP